MAVVLEQTIIHAQVVVIRHFQVQELLHSLQQVVALVDQISVEMAVQAVVVVVVPTSLHLMEMAA